MRNKVISCVICALIIANAFFMTTSTNTSASSTTVEYQIGVKLDGQNDNWSPWSSDGAIARVITYGMSGTMDFLTRINAPGYHINYQIGIRLANQNDNWSPWSSDGAIARITTYGLSGTMDFILRIEAPGNYVEYQIGVRLSGQNDNWSPWSSNGAIARVTTHGFTGTMEFIMRIKMTVPLEATIDIDPNTLNLKSKGRWITCYITLNEPYDVNDIDINTILLEDTIPAEWGDIQNDTLMVKFDRSEVEDMLSPGTYNLKVTGKLTDGTKFEGYSDEIRVIDPGK